MRPLLTALVALTFLSACDAGQPATKSVRYSVDGPAEVVFTDADGTSRSSSTSAAWEARVAVDPVTPVVLVVTSATGMPVTASIYIDDSLVRSRRGTSVRLEASSSDTGSSEAEVRGPVEAVGSDRVTVAGRVFIVVSDTELVADDNTPVALSAFTVGTYVEAEGRPLGDGSFRATKIKVEDEGDDNGLEVEVHGPIGAIDATSFTVTGRRFVTGSATRYLDDDNNVIARDDFRVGEFVEAEGHPLADGSVQAKKIKRDDD